MTKSIALNIFSNITPALSPGFSTLDARTKKYTPPAKADLEESNPMCLKQKILEAFYRQSQAKQDECY
jgi:hypothetical protein